MGVTSIPSSGASADGIITLETYIAGLDNDPKMNALERAILPVVRQIIEAQSKGLACPDSPQACYEKGKALIDSTTRGVTFPVANLNQIREGYILAELNTRLAIFRSPTVVPILPGQESHVAPESVPDIELTDMKGNKTHLRDYFGQEKIVVVVFWATWCEPCKLEVPELNRIQKKFSKKVTIVSMTPESPEDYQKGLQQWLATKAPLPHYPVFTDSSNAIYQTLLPDSQGVRVPQTLVYSPDGEQLSRCEGYNPNFLLSTLGEFR